MDNNVTNKWLFDVKLESEEELGEFCDISKSDGYFNHAEKALSVGTL